VQERLIVCKFYIRQNTTREDTLMLFYQLLFNMYFLKPGSC